MYLEDGKGGGYRAQITKENMLRVYAQIESEMSHVSENEEKAFSWNAAYNYAGNDTILWLRNDNQSEVLILDSIVMASDANTQATVHFPEGTTQAGTTVTGVNMNRGSGNIAKATAIEDETGNTQGAILGTALLAANMTAYFDMMGAAILNYLDEIAIDFVTVGTMGMANIRGYYHTIE